MEKHCKILPTLRYERLALSKGRKGVTNLNNCDIILHLVEKLIAERVRVQPEIFWLSRTMLLNDCFASFETREGLQS